MDKAWYRKMNDGSKSKSSYHKRGGTPVRARLKDLLRKVLNGRR